MTNKPGANGHYGYLFEEPVDEIAGDILIDLENQPPEMKQTILLLVKNAADRDAAQKALSDIREPSPPRNGPLKEWQFRSPPILAFSGL
ncbi:hypothetical protein V9M40_004220 [Salmonella enterica subsp. enterica serovar Newport]